jgi:hypothetical protein
VLHELTGNPSEAYADVRQASGARYWPAIRWLGPTS